MQNLEQDTDDRFSKLPISILDHIVSFLDIKSLARLSLASRIFREICRSCSKLSFCNKNLKNGMSHRLHFNSFLDRLVLHRIMNGVKTRSLNLCWSLKGTDEEEGYRIETWLQETVKSGLEELEIDITTKRGKPFFLPPCILDCGSLRFLSLTCNRSILRFPSTLFDSHAAALKLQTLRISHVRIENNHMGEWFSSLKSLKVLDLSHIKGIKSLNITGSFIEQLRIRSLPNLRDINIHLEKLNQLQIVWLATSPSSCKSFEIYAPNLQDFRWMGHAVDFYQYAEDLVSHELRVSICLLLSDQYKKNKVQTFHKVLCSIQSAISLKLSMHFIEALVKHGCLPFLFKNLEYLTVESRTALSGQQVQALSFLLKGTTNLKHLIILGPWYFSFIDETDGMPVLKMKYWESQNLTCIHQLKQVTMELLSEGENELELMKYLLKNGKELRALALLYPSALPSDFITELIKHKKPSTKLQHGLIALDSLGHDLRALQLDFSTL